MTGDSIQLLLFSSQEYLKNLVFDINGEFISEQQFNFPYNLKFSTIKNIILTSEESIIWGIADTGFIDNESAICVLNNDMEMQWKYVLDDTFGLFESSVVFNNDTIALLAGSGGMWEDGYYRVYRFSITGEFLSSFSVPRPAFGGYSFLLYNSGNYIIITDNSVFKLSEFSSDGILIRDTLIAWPDNFYTNPTGYHQAPIIQNNTLYHYASKSDDLGNYYSYVIKADMGNWEDITFNNIFMKNNGYFGSYAFPHVDDTGFDSYHYTIPELSERHFFYDNYDINNVVTLQDSFLLSEYGDFGSNNSRIIKSNYRPGFVHYFNEIVADERAAILYYEPVNGVTIDTLFVSYGESSDSDILEYEGDLYLYNNKLTLITPYLYSVELTRLSMMTDNIDSINAQMLEVIVLPNPASDYISIHGIQNPTNLNILDIDGQLVQTDILQPQFNLYYPLTN